MPAQEPLTLIGQGEEGSRVAFYTNFQEGISEMWNTTLTGAGSAIAADATIAEIGKQSMKLTHGAAAGRRAEFARSFSDLPISKLGIEGGLCFPQTGDDQFDLRVELWDDLTSKVYTAHVRLILTTTFTLQYWDSTPVFQTLESGISWTSDLFLSLKIVLDARGDVPVWDSVIMQGRTYPMQSAAMYSSSVVSVLRRTRLHMLWTANTAIARSVNIGHILYTIDEP